MRFLVLFICGCSGTTGGGLVTFAVRAGGSGIAEFDTGFTVAPSPGAGPIPYHVLLSSAAFHLGAVYFNSVVPSSGGPAEECIKSSGVYVGEIFGDCAADGCGLDLPNLLSSDFVSFPAPGFGTTTPASEAEVWLTSGDINADTDTVPILTAAGVASWNGLQWPFSASVTISAANRGGRSQSPATPGANPICRARIVGRIPVMLTLESGGTLRLRIDPSGMFNEVDFAALTPGSDGRYVIPDSNDDPEGSALYDGVVSNSGVYQFSFQ